MNRKERRKNKNINTSIDVNNNFQIAFNYHNSGDLGKAEVLYKRILIQNPNHFDTLRHLGILYQDLAAIDKTMLEKAEKFFYKANKVIPDHFAVFNNMGSVRFQQFKLEEAKELFLKGFELNPNYLPIINNLSLLYQKYQYEDEAMGYAKKGLEIDPNNLVVQTNYALALAMNKNILEAITILKNVLEKKPNLPNYINLGSAYRNAGEFKKSFDCFSKALEFAPNDPGAFFNLSASKLYKPDLASLARFENILLEDNGMNANDKAGIAFSLHRSYHKLKELDKSSKFLLLSNKITDDWVKTDIRKEELYFNELKNIFNKKFINENCLDKNKSDKSPIFILGMPRSGTTLCEQIISSHSKVYGGGELQALIRISGINSATYSSESHIEKVKEKLANFSNIDFINMSKKYINTLESISSDHQYITDKMPHNFVLIGLIKIIFPNAKIIYCKRDALDNCFSLYKHKFVDSSHGYCYNQEKLAKYYNLHLDLMKHWMHIFNDEIFTLDHEELIENQELVSKNLIEYCELEWEEECLEFYKNKRQVQTASNEQVREPINKKSIAAWRKYEMILEPLKKTLG